jgi:hypothetical protein
MTSRTVLVKQLGEICSRLSALEKGQESLRASVDRMQTSLTPASRSQADGPVAPDAFRLGGRLYESFTCLEWRLLSYLWGTDALAIDGVLDRLYGHDCSQGEGALRSLAKRLNAKLRDGSFPGDVAIKNGYVVLTLRDQVPGSGLGRERPSSDQPHCLG